MSVPRQILPGRFFKITRRCTQRQFLLRPDDETNNAFVYCLAEAAARFGTEVIASSAQSNHHHTDLFARDGRVVEFMEHFHKMMAKCMNALRGRWENFWSCEEASVVHLVDRSDVVDKVVYTLSNPVKDGLVDTVAHWPGVNTLKNLLTGKPLRATRPKHFFREDGVMPAEVTLHLTIPRELGDPDVFRSEVRKGVVAVEEQKRQERAETGRRVVGRARILRQSWRDSPTSHEPRRTLNPRVAARSKWHRIEALQRNKAFVAEYKAARLDWLAGISVVFPAGTYWLRRLPA
jgi:REP element-mobilizing transposase RayT